ncbi:MAG: glycosyltransferase 87 family protein [Candidatus Altiarchaeota archaeon]
MPDQTAKSISFDSVLLSVLVIANIISIDGYSFQKSFYVILLLAYVILDYLSNTGGKSKILLGVPLREHFRVHKYTTLLIIVFFILLWPAFSQISLRQAMGPEYYAHDGVIQTEYAAKFLLQGRNPYIEDYFNTPLVDWVHWDSDYGINPALYHYTYLPFLPLFTIPFYIFSTLTLGWFDLRLVFLALFALTFVLLGRIIRDSSRRLELLVLFFLNPWFVEFFDEGRNDIFIIAWIVLAIYSLRKDNIPLSAVFMAFAFSSKQTAWFLVPFYFAYLLKSKLDVDSIKKVIVKIKPFFIITAVVILPFFIWDYSSFIEDTFSYTSGSSKTSYPAGGYGLAAMLVQFGFMKSSDYFPFWIPQLVVGLPLLYILLRRQWNNNTMGAMITNYAILTFVVLFSSRLFQDNHLGYVASMLALGYYLD